MPTDKTLLMDTKLSMAVLKVCQETVRSHIVCLQCKSPVKEPQNVSQCVANKKAKQQRESHRQGQGEHEPEEKR